MTARPQPRQTISRIRTLWVDAERIEQHVHLKINMGWQYGQDAMPTYEKARNYRNDAGLAGTLIIHDHEWLPWIKALAAGGHATGLRVCWSEHTDDRRNLWNGTPDRPCILGTTDVVEWECADV